MARILPYLRNFKAQNFRNLQAQDLKFEKGFHFISGSNGMGKTNLLDAIYYLCITRSYFKYGDQSVFTHGEKWFRVESDFQIEEQLKGVVVKRTSRKPKVVELNGVAYQRNSEHVGLIPCVMITPADLDIVVGLPEERRRFLDVSLCQMDVKYLKALIVYNKILEARNALLKTAERPEHVDHSLLDVYDVQLQEPAAIIIQKRTDFIQQLNLYFESYYKAISNDAEPVEAIYQTKIDTNYRQLMQEVRMKDCILRRTTIGPHKDDLKVLMKQVGLKKFASQGQLKSAALALRLAQAKIIADHTSKSPILLLDDIFDRLDPKRVENLLQVIGEENYVQVFITDTHANRLESIGKLVANPYYYTMEDGLLQNVDKWTT